MVEIHTLEALPVKMQWDRRAKTDERHYDIGADMEAGDRRCCFDRSKRPGGDLETAVFVDSHSRSGERGTSGLLPGGGNCIVSLSECAAHTSNTLAT